MKALTMLADGVEGMDCGVYGAWQYAVRTDAQVLRRRAGDEGTYGGWRWECSIEHARHNPTLYPFATNEARTIMEAEAPCRHLPGFWLSARD
jgi:hypothetical protein